MDELFESFDMASTFKISGEWSTTLEGEKLPGELTYENGNITLEINGSFANSTVELLSILRFEKIFGWTSDNEKITLYNVQITLQNLSSVLREKYMADQLIIGCHVLPSTTFTSLLYNHELLSQWLSINPFQIKEDLRTADAKKNLQIDYTSPKTFLETFKINEETVNFESFFDKKITSDIPFEFTVRHESFLKVTPNNSKSIDWFTQTLFDFSNLFTNLIGRSIYVENIYLWSKDESSDVEPVKVKLFSKQISEKNYLNNLHSVQMPFPYCLIKENLKNIIQNWFHQMEPLKGIYNVLNSDYYSENYLEMDFINIIYGLEGLHRIVYKEEGKYIDKPTFRAYLKEIRSSLSQILIEEDQKELLNRISVTIASSNEVSLRTRIIYLIDKIEKNEWKDVILKKDEDEEQDEDSKNMLDHIYNEATIEFAKNVTNLRNDLTHIDFSEVRTHEIDYEKVYYFKGKLKRLLYFHVMHLQGIPKEIVINRIKESKYL